MKFLQTFAFILCLWASTSNASSDDDAEIEFLLTSVGNSGCVFIRNGNEHTAEDAEKHLRMKYRRGKKWAKDAESFVERIATGSSFSGTPYRIRCGEESAQLTSIWLRKRLSKFTRE